MKKLTLRGMTPDDRAGFEALTALRPGYDLLATKNRADLIWHIAFKNPTSDGQPTYFVVTDGERLLCHMGRIPTWFWVEGKRHLAAFAHDLFAHPELQATGAGFFATMRLYKAVEEACPSFAALLWTNEINIKLQQARRYDQLWVKRHARPLDATRQIAEKLPFVPAPLLALAGKASRAAITAGDAVLRRRRGQAPVEPIFGADPRFDRLAERVGPRLGTAPIKDSAYVQWKYFAWPNLNATVLAVPSGPDLRGFVVLRDPDHAGDPGRILDLVAAPDDEEALDALVAAALSHYRSHGLTRVECVATFPAVARALERFYFVERGPETPLFFLNGHKYPNVAFLRRLDTWGHEYGDSEGGEAP